jgi:outer membrane murein-binding lipoprotein Lpp
MTVNGNEPPSHASDFEQFYRAVAGLELAFEKVARNQESLKTEVKTIAPRLDSLGTRIDTLAADLGKLSERVHAANNLVTRALDEAARVHEEHNVLDRALDHFEGELRVRTGTLARAQRTLENMVDVLETRVRRLRDSVIPGAPNETPTLNEGKSNG